MYRMAGMGRIPNHADLVEYPPLLSAVTVLDAPTVDGYRPALKWKPKLPCLDVERQEREL